MFDVFFKDNVGVLQVVFELSVEVLSEDNIKEISELLILVLNVLENDYIYCMYE